MADEQQTTNRVNQWFRQGNARLIFLAGLLLIVVWLSWKSWRLARVALSLRAHQESAETLMEGGLTGVDPDAAEELAYGLRADIVVLNREVRPFLPLARLFTWVPQVGPLFREAEPLLNMADGGTEAAAYAARGLKPALALLQDGGGGEELIPQLLPILEAAEPDLRAADAAMRRVVEARNSIEDTSDLPWRVQSLLAQIDSKLYLAEEMRLLPVLPALLGVDGQRTYLIVAQNEDELRATGGFITGAGLLTVDEGRILDLSFEDANVLDDWQNKPYDFPPDPLYELMGLELFLFRDTNFWPDYPTSAEHTMELYQYGQDSPPLDGIITINQEFVSRLLAVTGPVTISDLEMTVTSQNAIASLRDAWGMDEEESVSEWVPNRKDFLGPLAQSLKQQLFSNLGDIDLLFLAHTIHEAAQEKHLQMYVRDPQVAAVLDDINWDSRLEEAPQSDLLMAVDTNVGYNKVNELIERTLLYEVTLEADGTGTGELSLRYEHTGEQGAVEQCSQTIEYHETLQYESLMQRCFWNYLRVYVPTGSSLQEATRHEVSEDLFTMSQGWQGQPSMITERDGHTAIENFFLLQPGETLRSDYRYELPQVVTEQNDERRYEFYLYKQSGQAEEAVEVRIHLPEGASVLSTTPQATVDGQTITFRTGQTSDQRFSVSFR
ncbi:MAG: DUF4012 domain-containing protein [Chloroflexota bacterium]